MSSYEETRAHRCALIAEITKKLGRLGRTALMKLLFILQENKKINLGYRFRLYTYGPFDAAVLDDLDFVEALEGVKVSYHGELGYEIVPGDRTDLFRKEAEKFLGKYNSAIEKVLSDFKRYSAKELELIATIMFVYNEIHDSLDVIKKVHAIKPHFDEKTIEQYLNELKALNYLK